MVAPPAAEVASKPYPLPGSAVGIIARALQHGGRVHGTKLADGRGQISFKGHVVNDEWELVRKAVEPIGTTFAGFVVDHTTVAAQAILKGEAVVPAAPPMRIEDVAVGIAEQVASLAERQEARLVDFAAEQQARLDRIERTARRGRWLR